MSSRQHFWPEPTALKTKLWGPADDMRKTTNFVEYHGLKNGHWRTQKKKKQKSEGRLNLDDHSALTFDPETIDMHVVRLPSPVTKLFSIHRKENGAIRWLGMKFIMVTKMLYKAILQLDHKEPSPYGTHKIRTKNGTES
jgi:hypothetical protein